MDTAAPAVTPGPRRLPHRPLAVPPLEALGRRRARPADARHRRGRGRPPRLQAQAQQLRPRRRHRAGRRAQPGALRASRGALGDRHQRQGPGVLLRRQHLHARRLEPRLEGELLQVHQRDPQRHRGHVDAFGHQVRRRGQRRLRRRRLRAGPGLRRDHPGRRPLVVGLAARGAAARRAAGHRRPDPRHRQAQGPPRPRRHLLHQRRRRARPARGRVAAGRRRRQAGAVRDRRPRPRRQAGRRQPAARRGEGRRADAARARRTRPTASAMRTSPSRSTAASAPRRSPSRRRPARSLRTSPRSKPPAPPGGRWRWRASSTTPSSTCAPTSSRSAPGS